MREQIKQTQGSAGHRIGEDVWGFTAGQNAFQRRGQKGVVGGMGTPG